jgi:hypothetical protein
MAVRVSDATIGCTHDREPKPSARADRRSGRRLARGSARAPSADRRRGLGRAGGARGGVHLPPTRRDRTLPRRRGEAVPATETHRRGWGALANRVACGGRPRAKGRHARERARAHLRHPALALGARPREAVAGALTFRGPQDGPALSALLEKTTAGAVHRIAFAVPAGASWPLPLYELAILTAEYMSAHGTRGVEIFLVTPEDRPLSLFGLRTSAAGFSASPTSTPPATSASSRSSKEGPPRSKRTPPPRRSRPTRARP